MNTISILAASAAAPQDEALRAAETGLPLSTSAFFAALLVGFLLALAFQLLLTNLSLAAGASAARLDPDEHGAGTSSTSGGSGSTSLGSKLRKAVHGAGIWALLTCSVSLFFACWLAIELTPVLSPLVGAVLGLGVWAGFTLFLLVFEASTASLFFGSLVQAATSGARTAGHALRSAFSTSEKKELAEEAAAVTAAVRDEIFEDSRVEDLRAEIRDYLEHAPERRVEPREVRRQLEKLLARIELESRHGSGESGDVVHTSVRTSSMPSKATRSKIGEAARAAGGAAREEAGAEKSTAAKVGDAGMRAAGLEPEQAQRVRERVAEHLRGTRREELEPESLRRDFETLLRDPEEGWRRVRERARAIDRNTLFALIGQRGDVQRGETEGIVGRIESAIDAVARRFGGGERSGDGSRRGRAGTGSGDVESVERVGDVEVGVGEDYGYAREVPSQGTTARRAPEEPSGGGVEQRLREYLDDLDRPELEYDVLRRDLRRMMDDPKASGEVLAARMRALDRDSLRAIVASLPGRSEEDVDRMARELQKARDEVLARAERMKEEVQRRLEETRHAALEGIESTRRTAAAAAWWALATGLVSGAAAALGGIVAVAT